MDPDANLAEQRRIVERIHRSRMEGRKPSEVDVFRLAELVRALDEWIRHGGFLPDTWDRKRTIPRENSA